MYTVLLDKPKGVCRILHPSEIETVIAQYKKEEKNYV